MKIKPIYWICLALALALGVAICDGLRIRDKGSIIAGRYQETAAIAKTDAKLKDALIAKQKVIIGQWDKEIAEKTETIGHMTNDIGQAKKSEINAKAESDKLKTEIQPAIDANPKLKEFVGGLEARLVQKDDIIAKQDALVLTLGVPKIEGFMNGIPFFSFPEGSVTYNLNQTRIGEAMISGSWKAKYDAECRLLQLATRGWKASERKLRWTRIESNIEKLVVLGLGGKVIYDAIKGT